MDAFITRRGSGGAALNFEVVGGTVQPENPKENTIWVNTDREITGWSFSAEEPAEPAEGMVWIKTATSSFAGFNALKKNSISILPIYAAQYTGQAWENVPAVIYQNMEWTELKGKVYFVSQGVSADDFLLNAATASYSVMNGYAQIKSNPGTSGNGWVFWSIGGDFMDLSMFSKLCFDIAATSTRKDSYDDKVRLGTTNGTMSGPAISDFTSVVAKSLRNGQPIVRQVLEIDISDVSAGLIAVYISDANTTALQVYDAWLI